jgi:transposase
MAYSKDLREKVMEYIVKGNTQEAAAQVFGVSVSAIKEWKTLKAETGSLAKRKLDRKPRKYTAEKMTKILAEQPDAYLSEIAEKFENGSISGVQSALKRMKITLKKRQKRSKSAVKRSDRNTKKP